ncbi:MAG: phosphoribosylformylglycinamidine cyclo-ligase [Litorilinea sp.]
MTADSRYKAAGVDIEAGNRAVAQMKPAIRSTYSANVLADVGSFGGLFALNNLPNAPVLVASIDGVGTKVKLAAQVVAWETARGSDAARVNQIWQGIGHDLVNHCVNDILVQNARPLFFLDYVAASKLAPDVVAQVVMGMADACRAAGCALLGGETAEMPGVYAPGALDVAGAVVGLVDRAAILPNQTAMRAGDLLVGLPSSGPHTNGYSLIRRALVPGGDDAVGDAGGAAALLDTFIDNGAGGKLALAQALLMPHRSYVGEIDHLTQADLLPKGLAHITGGGFFDNVPRILPEHLAARVEPTRWEPGPLFGHIVEKAELEQAEAYRVLNMGMGMVLVIDAAQVDAVQACLPDARVMGELMARGAQDAPFVLG